MIINDFNIPVYDAVTKEFSYRLFENRKSFKDYIFSLFRYPGEYEFSSYTDEAFRKMAANFQRDGYYESYIERTPDWVDFWDLEKEKCRKGLIVLTPHGEYYLTRELYMWLNYLPIYHKDKDEFKFPDIYDGQYHIALAQLMAELDYKHIAFLKKRQYAMSYYHCAKIINNIWFEGNITIKFLGYLDTYINSEGSWMFIEEYRNFLNNHTAWKRNFEPDKVGNWQQRIKTRKNGVNIFIGNSSRLIGISTKDNPTKGVGGASKYIMVEEAGVNPTMNKTYGYAKAGLESGMMTTGTFIAYGSVGELSQCGPLMKFMLEPSENGFMSYPCRDYDESGIERECGLFAPVQWNMLPFSDKHGNSLIEEAKAALREKRAIIKKTLSDSDYLLEVSQNPMTVEEAFQNREANIFPVHLVNYNAKLIEEGNYPYERVSLVKNNKGEIEVKTVSKDPIDKFPVDKKMPDKTGVIQVWERPREGVELGEYVASVDPVTVGETTASDSLCSIYVYKLPRIVQRTEGDSSNFISEQGKIVCAWTGRFDDIRRTNEQLQYIVEWYKARTIVENNIPTFIQHMIERRLTKFLVMKNEFVLDKIIGTNVADSVGYGWRNNGGNLKMMMNLLIDALTEVIGEEVDELGNVTKVHYGIERIPDLMAMVEMKSWAKGLNVDRLVTLCALFTYVKIVESNYSKITIKEDNTKNLENDRNLFKLNKGAFSRIGKATSLLTGRTRSGFKNLR